MARGGVVWVVVCVIPLVSQLSNAVRSRGSRPGTRQQTWDPRGTQGAHRSHVLQRRLTRCLGRRSSTPVVLNAQTHSFPTVRPLSSLRSLGTLEALANGHRSGRNMVEAGNGGQLIRASRYDMYDMHNRFSKLKTTKETSLLDTLLPTHNSVDPNADEMQRISRFVESANEFMVCVDALDPWAPSSLDLECLVEHVKDAKIRARVVRDIVDLARDFAVLNDRLDAVKVQVTEPRLASSHRFVRKGLGITCILYHIVKSCSHD
eukprot:1391765-Amorphochlora_amoeboformis.AAC.1